jgi:hypothetical protein
MASSKSLQLNLVKTWLEEDPLFFQAMVDLVKILTEFGPEFIDDHDDKYYNLVSVIVIRRYRKETADETQKAQWIGLKRRSYNLDHDNLWITDGGSFTKNPLYVEAGLVRSTMCGTGLYFNRDERKILKQEGELVQFHHNEVVKEHNIMLTLEEFTFLVKSLIVP